MFYNIYFSLLVMICCSDVLCETVNVNGSQKNHINGAKKTGNKLKNIVSLSKINEIHISHSLDKVKSFEDALAAAYVKNPSWLGQLIEQRIANESSKQAKMMFLPDINANFGVGRSDEDNINRNPNGHHMRSTTDFGVTVVQNIFNGFGTLNNMKMSNDNAKATFYKIRSAEQKLIIDVLEAYTSVWVARQMVDAWKKKSENLKKTWEHQRSSLEAGMGTVSEAAQAEANYQKAVSDAINAETKLFSAVSTFEKLTGVSLDENIELPVIDITLPNHIDDLINESLQNNSNVLQAKYASKAAHKALLIEKGKLAPRCDLQLKAERSLDLMDSHARADYNSTQTKYMASLQVVVPIFANSQYSGNTYSAINIASEKAKQADYSTKDIELEIRKECVINWNNYLSANAMIEAVSSAVKSAELSTSSNAEETAMGLKSSTDVLVKENQLLESRIDLASAKQQKVMALVKMFALTGNLSIKSLVEDGVLWRKSNVKQHKDYAKKK